MARVYIGLVHYPIYNKHNQIVTTAITNFDIHDIARTARTYGIDKYFLIPSTDILTSLSSLLNILTIGSGYNCTINQPTVNPIVAVIVANLRVSSTLSYFLHP